MLKLVIRATLLGLGLSVAAAMLASCATVPRGGQGQLCRNPGSTRSQRGVYVSNQCDGDMDCRYDDPTDSWRCVPGISLEEQRLLEQP